MGNGFAVCPMLHGRRLWGNSLARRRGHTKRMETCGTAGEAASVRDGPATTVFMSTQPITVRVSVRGGLSEARRLGRETWEADGPSLTRPPIPATSPFHLRPHRRSLKARLSRRVPLWAPHLNTCPPPAGRHRSERVGARQAAPLHHLGLCHPPLDTPAPYLALPPLGPERSNISPAAVSETRPQRTFFGKRSNDGYAAPESIKPPDGSAPSRRSRP